MARRFCYLYFQIDGKKQKSKTHNAETARKCRNTVSAAKQFGGTEESIQTFAKAFSDVLIR